MNGGNWLEAAFSCVQLLKGKNKKIWLLINVYVSKNTKKLRSNFLNSGSNFFEFFNLLATFSIQVSNSLGFLRAQ